MRVALEVTRGGSACGPPPEPDAWVAAPTRTACASSGVSSTATQLVSCSYQRLTHCTYCSYVFVQLCYILHIICSYVLYSYVYILHFVQLCIRSALICCLMFVACVLYYFIPFILSYPTSKYGAIAAIFFTSLQKSDLNVRAPIMEQNLRNSISVTS